MAATSIPLPPLSSADYNRVMENLKVLALLEGWDLLRLYKSGKLLKAQKLADKMDIVDSTKALLEAYTPESEMNWITDEEANKLVDYLNDYYDLCNIRTNTFNLVASIVDGSAIYQNGVSIALNDGTLLTY